MNKKMIVLPMLGLILAGGLTSTAFAAEDGSGWRRDGATHEKIELTDAQKTALGEARTLRKNGDHDGAQATLEAAGLKDMGFHGKRGDKGGRPEMSDEMKAKHEAIKAAIEAEDYDAFVIAAEGSPFANLTETQFATLIEAHKLHEAGKHKAAHKLMKSLGLKKGDRSEKAE